MSTSMNLVVNLRFVIKSLEINVETMENGTIKWSFFQALQVQLIKMVAFVWIAWKILVLVLQFVRYVSEKVFRWIHERDAQTILPAITDDILMQSAVSIASKIRSQEANIYS